MREIAGITYSVLSASTPATVNDKKSLAKVDIDPKVVDAARARTRALLDKFPLYPQLDLSIMLKGDEA